MARNIRKNKTNNKDISYLNRYFESFRNELVRYAKTHYSDTIQDYTESSLAGMFVDMAAYVGDILSFYQDHQFNELSLETAVEDANIERLIRNSGIEITGASPSIIELNVQIKVDALKNSIGEYAPNKNLLPVVNKRSVFSSKNGISFELLENIDFSEVDANGELLAKIEIAESDSLGFPIFYYIKKVGYATSSKTEIEVIPISDTFTPFRKITLGKSDISEIISIKDSEEEEYYEVKSLTQDTVYIRQKNDLPDFLSVPERLKLIPAPRRFEKVFNAETRNTTVIFGSGNEDLFDEDVIPDPSEHAVKLFGDRKTLPFITIDPNSFLSTSTLGISPKSTSLTVRYRYGGGVNHNVAANQVNAVKTLITKFQESTPTNKVASIRASLTCNNPKAASGGENPPTLKELRQLALSGKNSQGRIVTKEDLLARIYSMPNKFGRVFRAGIRNNPFNPFASHLHVISRDDQEKLTYSSDSLKENLSKFLENYRLITDAIDIVDARIVNIGVEYSITIDANESVDVTLQTVNAKLIDYFDIRNFQIDMPIIVSEIQNIIQNTRGVVSLLDFDIKGKLNSEGLNKYSETKFEALRYTNRGILYPPPGGIFEVKYPNDDIKGRVK